MAVSCNSLATRVRGPRSTSLLDLYIYTLDMLTLRRIVSAVSTRSERRSVRHITCSAARNQSDAKKNEDEFSINSIFGLNENKKTDANASSLIADIEKLLREQTQKQLGTTASDAHEQRVDPNDTDALFKTLFPSASTDPSEPLKTTSDIFNEVFGVTKKKQLTELKYWDLYPAPIKRWLVYLKTPKGYYDNSGRWVSASGTPMTRVTEEGEDGEEVTRVIPEPVTADSVRDTEWSNKDSAEWQRWEQRYQDEQRALAPELRGHFRFALTAEQMQHVHPKLRRLLSMTHARPSEVTALRKRLIREKWATHSGDTGSDSVQIGILTLRIRVLTEHLQKNKQDKYNAYRLQRLVKRRRGLLRHLKRNDVPTYYRLLKDLRLRDMIEMV